MLFAGRTLELQALDAALAAACPRVVVIEAPAVASKTALVEQWLAGVGRRRVLRVSGEPNEAEIALGVVDQLLRRAGGAFWPWQRDDAGALTPQEITVAQLVASGHSDREVASDLQLSVKTVEVHLTRIYAKLGISSRGQLAARL